MGPTRTERGKHALLTTKKARCNPVKFVKAAETLFCKKCGATAMGPRRMRQHEQKAHNPIWVRRSPRLLERQKPALGCSPTRDLSPPTRVSSAILSDSASASDSDRAYTADDLAQPYSSPDSSEPQTPSSEQAGSRQGSGVAAGRLQDESGNHPTEFLRWRAVVPLDVDDASVWAFASNHDEERKASAISDGKSAMLAEFDAWLNLRPAGDNSVLIPESISRPVTPYYTESVPDIIMHQPRPIHANMLMEPVLDIPAPPTPYYAQPDDISLPLNIPVMEDINVAEHSALPPTLTTDDETTSFGVLPEIPSINLKNDNSQLYTLAEVANAQSELQEFLARCPLALELIRSGHYEPAVLPKSPPMQQPDADFVLTEEDWAAAEEVLTNWAPGSDISVEEIEERLDVQEAPAHYFLPSQPANSVGPAPSTMWLGTEEMDLPFPDMSAFSALTHEAGAPFDQVSTSEAGESTATKAFDPNGDSPVLSLGMDLDEFDRIMFSPDPEDQELSLN